MSTAVLNRSSTLDTLRGQMVAKVESFADQFGRAPTSAQKAIGETGAIAALDAVTAYMDRLEAELAELRTASKANTNRVPKSRAAKRQMPLAGNDNAFSEYEKHHRAFALAKREQLRSEKRRQAPRKSFADVKRKLNQSRPIKINIAGEISEATARAVRARLERQPERKCVEVIINSPGGEIAAATDIHDMLRAREGSVHTHAVCNCSSAANLILLAGEKRTAESDCAFFLHRATFGDKRIPTPSSEAELDNVTRRMSQTYALRTGKSAWHWQRLMTLHGNSLSAARAKDYALINEITETTEQRLAA